MFHWGLRAVVAAALACFACTRDHADSGPHGSAHRGLCRLRRRRRRRSTQSVPETPWWVAQATATGLQRSLPRPPVGGVQPDLEVILQLKPDLVVGMSGAASSMVAEKLDARGIPNWFPQTESLAGIDALIAGVGERTGHAAEARLVIERVARTRAGDEPSSRG